MSPNKIADLHRAERALASVVHDAIREIDRLGRDPQATDAALTLARRRYDAAAIDHAALLGRIDALEFEMEKMS